MGADGDLKTPVPPRVGLRFMLRVKACHFIEMPMLHDDMTLLEYMM